jgi:hypothetical protein
MPVSVVLDHPRGYLGLRLWRQFVTLLGAVLLIVGIAASIVAVPANVLAGAWLLGENIDLEIGPGRTLSANEILLAWAIATPVAILGLRRGFRFVRGGRKLVLFLRRFGYDDVTSAVTFATRTIGSRWRLVTLDDAEIAPLGVATGTRRFFRAIEMTSAALFAVVNLLLRVFPAVQLGLWVVLGADLARARIWEQASSERAWMAVLNPYLQIVETTLGGRLPLDSIGPDLPGVFAFFAVVLAGIVIGLGTALTAAPLAWVLGAVLLLFLQFPTDAVREAERSKTHDVRTREDIAVAGRIVADWSRKVFGPRLVVLRVATSVWRQTVSRLASDASLSLIDVSEPTENLIWEIEELTIRSRTRCVFICQHERAVQLAGSSSSSDERPLDGEVQRLLEMEQLLAYTTDRRGRKRFARALRGRLLSLADGD